MAAQFTDPRRQARFARVKEIVGDALPDFLEPLSPGRPTTVIYISGGTVTLGEPAIAPPPDRQPEPA